MPEGGLRSDVAHALVRDELFLDGNARQNLATFCQTYLNDDIHELMDLSIDKNMIDKDEYPADGRTGKPLRPHSCRSAEFAGSRHHARLLDHRVERSLHAGRPGAQAQMARADESCGQADDKPNLVTGPVQVCWHKFARYFDVELREIPLERAASA